MASRKGNLKTRRRYGVRRKVRLLGFAVAVFAVLPTTVGEQDLASLLAQQPGVAERARAHLIASPFGTIHAAMFSLPRPVGTEIPRPVSYTLASLDPNDVTQSIAAQPWTDPNAPFRFPTVNRAGKRDSMLSRARTPMPPMPALAVIERDPGAQLDLKRKEEGPQLELYSSGDVFFGREPLAGEQKRLSPWAPGDAPVVIASGDPDVKLSALSPPTGDIKIDEGESVASKGVVTGPDQRPRSPAERLSLAGAKRTQAEKCLAHAIYFEARDEPITAQMAVAQVVLNRVFSPYYPNDVCGVVYQNKHRHLACQFTFACDGKSKAIREPKPYELSMRLARDSLDGKLWMPQVAKSTHYHDDWARPNWIGEMKRMDKLGGLIFYRPRNWGDGAAQPSWGDPKQTLQEARKLVEIYDYARP